MLKANSCINQQIYCLVNQLCLVRSIEILLNLFSYCLSKLMYQFNYTTQLKLPIFDKQLLIKTQNLKILSFLMVNNRTKTLSGRKPFYYKDINCIKNHNKNITKIKTETRTIYQKIIQEGSKQHTIAGEQIGKNKYHI